jgi:hypothetical protein
MLLQQAHESLGRRLVGARGHREAWTEGLNGLEDKRRVRNCHSIGRGAFAGVACNAS